MVKQHSKVVQHMQQETSLILQLVKTSLCHSNSQQ